MTKHKTKRKIIDVNATILTVTSNEYGPSAPIVKWRRIRLDYMLSMRNLL